MDLQKMLEKSVNASRQVEFNQQIRWTNDNRLQNTYVALDAALADIANGVGWFKVWQKNSGFSHKDVLIDYVNSLNYYLLIANLKNWNQTIFDSQAKLKRISSLKREEILNKQYLAIKQTLLSSYFKKDENSFKHSWTLFLKFGLVDLGFSEEEILAEFEKEQTKKTSLS